MIKNLMSIMSVIFNKKNSVETEKYKDTSLDVLVSLHYLEVKEL